MTIHYCKVPKIISKLTPYRKQCAKPIQTELFDNVSLPATWDPSPLPLNNFKTAQDKATKIIQANALIISNIEA